MSADKKIDGWLAGGVLAIGDAGDTIMMVNGHDDKEGDNDDYDDTDDDDGDDDDDDDVDDDDYNLEFQWCPSQ